MKRSELESYEANLNHASPAHSARRGVVLTLVLFAIIPGVFFFAALQLTKATGPQWLGSNFENSYMYLMNSLLIVKGESPYQIEHPGTTTELFGAACLRLSGHGSGDALISAVLESPEPFLKQMHRALLVFCALAVWFFPWLTAQRTKSLVTGLLLQAPTLFFVTTFNYSIWYCSDLLLVVPSLAAVSICVLLIRQRKEGTVNLVTCVIAGVICGFGITTKLTFFPLILITVFSCRGLKPLLCFGAGFLVSTALFLIPIYSQLYRVFNWIVALATHTGYYGSGEVGFARWDVYLPDLMRLFSMEPVGALIPGLATVALVVMWLINRRQETESRGRPVALTAVAIFVLQLVSFLVVAKHADNHYLIPLYLSSGLNLVLLYQALQRPTDIGWTKVLKWGVLAALLVIGIGNLFMRIPALGEVLQQIKREQLSMYRRVNERTKGAVRIDYYRSISPEFAVYFGNFYAGRSFAQDLQRIYPRALFLDIWSGRFDTFSSYDIEPSIIIQKYEHLYFFGNRNAHRFDASLKYFSLKGLCNVDSQGEYILEEWVRPSSGTAGGSY